MNYIISTGLKGCVIYSFDGDEMDPGFVYAAYVSGNGIWGGKFPYYKIDYWVKVVVYDSALGYLIVMAPEETPEETERIPNPEESYFVLNTTKTAFFFIDKIQEVELDTNFKDFSKSIETFEYRNPRNGSVGILGRRVNNRADVRYVYGRPDISSVTWRIIHLP